MKRMRNLMMIRRVVFPALTAVFSLLMGRLALAQVPTPTPEQLQMFQGLSADQQQALLRQVGGGASNSGSTYTQKPVADRAKPQDELARRVAVAEPASVGLQSGDLVVIELNLLKERIKVTPLGGTVPPIVVREPITLEGLERQKLEGLLDQIRARNPYTLDRDGQLRLPGFDLIALAGLSEEQASLRLASEPAMTLVELKVKKLPVARAGTEALKRFGYELFDDANSTFAPLGDVPVPADYVVGPGDELNVQLFGSQNRNLKLVVTREGAVSFPELGPVSVAGQTFSSAKGSIESRVSQQMIGVRANVSMGDVRSIRVFVLGEARKPGSYTVSGLATMTSALFASGGVKPIGSLRDIQLKRQGAVVRHLDLYDLLVRGDTSNDAKLLPGDVIFIPPVGPTVSADGEVKRPAIYELRGESSVAELLAMSGGLTPEADPTRASLLRVDEQARRVAVDVNLSQSAGRTRKLRNGDQLQVLRLRPQIDSGVTLAGFVHRPGVHAWREGLRLTDVIGSVDELQPNADLGYVLIRRERVPDRKIEVLSADLSAALSARGSKADLVLQPRDQITVFDLASGRERIIKPLLDELRVQSSLNRPTEVVRVQGRVKVPGEYPLELGMRVLDLLRAGGNLSASAYGDHAELIRYEVDGAGARQTEVKKIDLAAARRGDAAANLELRPFDYLLVMETPNWTDDETVTLKGEVRFPGIYPIRRGETLREVLSRAGGLTPNAFVKGSVFTRKELQELEQKQLDLLTERLQRDLASMSLQAAAANQAGASQSMAAGQNVLTQLKSTKAVGRLVIDLPGVVAGAVGSAQDVVLKPGDQLAVPGRKQEVTVIGEVQSATSHLYRAGLSREEYVELSGGFTRKADKGRIYVVRADGSVVAQKGSMFKRNGGISVQPGDTVVVPLDTERMPKLPLWQSVTQIIYNLTVAFAAVKTF